MPSKNYSVVMTGATGAVGQQVVFEMLKMPGIVKISLLGRRKLEGLEDSRVNQHIVDIFDRSSFEKYIPSHDVAICTVGVGQPSKVSFEEFVKIDKTSVISFAEACQSSGVKHFQLLSSVSSNAKSPSNYLKVKGQLNEALENMAFDRLSIFQPSMILTPTNRYGFSQALTLTVWPWLSHLLWGPLKKFRGIKVESLGRSIAKNLQINNSGTEYLTWQDFQQLDK